MSRDFNVRLRNIKLTRDEVTLLVAGCRLPDGCVVLFSLRQVVFVVPGGRVGTPTHVPATVNLIVVAPYWRRFCIYTHKLMAYSVAKVVAAKGHCNEGENVIAVTLHIHTFSPAGYYTEL